MKLKIWHLKYLKNKNVIKNYRHGPNSVIFFNDSVMFFNNRLAKKQCFSLILYGLCSSNALYLASLSFRMFIFCLTPFDTYDCYYFGCL